MEFGGFPDEGLMFYEGLEADNTKAYWVPRKPVYEASVREPMLALMETLSGEFGDGKLFRPYRDVRFAKDKTPYKTHQGAYVQAGLDGVGYYVQLDVDGLYVGGGWWSAGEMTARFRAALHDEEAGSRLEKIVDGLRGEFEVGGDRLKTRPRGVDPDHPRLDLLRHKSLYVGRRHQPGPWIHTPEAAERVREAWRAVTPLIDWLRVRLS